MGRGAHANSKFLVIALFAAIATQPCFAAQKDHKLCARETGTIDQQIAACTRMIADKSELKQNRSPAYGQRGSAWNNRGKYDQAIADHDQAISINPKLAGAFSGRRAEQWNPSR